jgi:hypothetical protein
MEGGATKNHYMSSTFVKLFLLVGVGFYGAKILLKKLIV